MKMSPVGAELSHADGPTDRQKQTDKNDGANSFF